MKILKFANKVKHNLEKKSYYYIRSHQRYYGLPEEKKSQECRGVLEKNGLDPLSEWSCRDCRESLELTSEQMKKTIFENSIATIKDLYNHFDKLWKNGEKSKDEEEKFFEQCPFLEMFWGKLSVEKYNTRLLRIYNELFGRLLCPRKISLGELQ